MRQKNTSDSLSRAAEALGLASRTTSVFDDPAELLQKVLDTIPQRVFWKDRNMVYLGCNQLFAIDAGLKSPVEIVGMTDFDLPWDDSEAAFFRECDQRVMDAGQPEVGIVEPQMTASGERIWLETNKVPLHDDTGAVIGVLGTYHDITKQKQAEAALKQTNEDLEKRVSDRTQKLRFLAEHDNLTGVLNRGTFVEQLNLAIPTRQAAPFALLFVDLDRFKSINDTEGHKTGDHVLIEVARVLTEELRADDVIGRFGGDEFVALARNVGSAEASAICDRVHCRLAKIQASGRAFPISASIGVLLSRTALATADEMLRDADIAMYVAKASEKQRHCIYDGEVLERAKRAREMQHEIQAAVAKAELTLRYQPIVNLIDNTVTGLEALIRWEHPTRGLVPPLEFIPIAEKIGVISEIGEFVLRDACAQLQSWRNTLPDFAGELTISVNVSAVQITEPNFANKARAIVAGAGLPPEAVKFEVTESVLLRDSDAATRVLKELQADGFAIVLDDFGTGYSSLSYLDQLPINTVKIDKSFVQKLGTPECSKAIVLMILALAKTLNMSAVAEGVETPTQADVLREMQCDQAQGYLFGRPMTAAKATAYLCQASRLEQPAASQTQSDAAARS